VSFTEILRNFALCKLVDHELQVVGPANRRVDQAACLCELRGDATSDALDVELEPLCGGPIREASDGKPGHPLGPVMRIPASTAGVGRDELGVGLIGMRRA
jgi:hypothetical protein